MTTGPGQVVPSAQQERNESAVQLSEDLARQETVENEEDTKVVFLGENEIDQLKKAREICLLENTKTTQLIDSGRK